MGGADAVNGSLADSRLGHWFPGAPEACPSVRLVPSRWDAVPRPADGLCSNPEGSIPDGQIFDVITNSTSPLPGHRCLSRHVVG